ncbi:phage tail protein [Streptomyces sp. NPDC001406]|uniref:phage tail protein n=1 Tax=Streptomyces sp. NPDC001406 TaxID=3364572 RepID=UPI003677C963
MPILAGPAEVVIPVLLPQVGFATAVFIDADGVTWPLTDTADDNGFFTLAEGVSGLGAAPRELTKDDHPRGGSRLRHVQPVSRTIVWPLHVFGATHMEFVTRWRQLASAFTGTVRLRQDGTRIPGILEIARPDGTRRRIKVYYSEGFDGQGKQGTGIVSDAAILSLYCEDPFWYDSVAIGEHRGIDAGGTVDFLSPYPSISSSQVLGATSLTNPGEVTAWPTWTITGPGTAVTVTHSGTGESFLITPASVGGTLAAKDKVIVATDPPKVTKYTAEQQTINLGAATAGTITITFDGQTTASIAFNATAATVQAALEALPNIGVGNIFVTGGPLPGTITLTFAGKFLGVNVSQVTVTPTGLTGGTVTVNTTVQGGTANWVGALNWPGARLWGLPPGVNPVTFSVSGSATGSAVDVAFNPRYETA